MFLVTLLLVLPLVAAPAMLILDGPIVHGIVMAVASLLAAITAIQIRPSELDFLLSIIRRIAVISLLPALWMLIQLLPLSGIGLANPIWDSASAALGKQLSGSITVDTGMTLISLAEYLSMASIAIVASAVALDRHRAEWILFTLTIATTLISLLVLIDRFGVINLEYRDGLARSAASDCAAIGVILAAASALQALERGYLKARDQSVATTPYWFAFLACILAAAICLFAVFASGSGQVYFAAAGGVATLIVAILIRRFRFGLWGYAALGSIALVILFACVAFKTSGQETDLTLAFAAHASKPLIAVTERILAATGWTGSGAGAFSALLPIYHDYNELTVGSFAPTAAAEIAIELGRPFAYLALLAMAALAITLLRGATRRGRDPYYSMASASCAVVITILAFSNAAVFSTPVLLITSATLGIGIAQSKSRTT